MASPHWRRRPFGRSARAGRQVGSQDRRGPVSLRAGKTINYDGASSSVEFKPDGSLLARDFELHEIRDGRDTSVEHIDNVAPQGFPEIFIVSNAIRDGNPIGAREVGRHWHTDFQHLKAAAALTMLHARKIPPENGDTEFADMRAAYDALPEATKVRIDGLEVLHSRVKAWPVMFPDRPPLTPEKAARTPDVVHPLVRIHPETRRRSLYVTANKAAWEILGMPHDEGQALLRELLEFAVQPRFRFTHVWSDGDYLAWDNRCLLHRATPFDAERHERIMYRTTVAGDPTFGPPRRAASGAQAAA